MGEAEIKKKICKSLFCQKPLGINFTGDFTYNGYMGWGLMLDNRTYRNTGMLRPIGKVPFYSLRIRNWLKISCGSCENNYICSDLVCSLK